jgi:hypothetical protein
MDISRTRTRVHHISMCRSLRSFYQKLRNHGALEIHRRPDLIDPQTSPFEYNTISFTARKPHDLNCSYAVVLRTIFWIFSIPIPRISNIYKWQQWRPEYWQHQNHRHPVWCQNMFSPRTATAPNMPETSMHLTR